MKKIMFVLVLILLTLCTFADQYLFLQAMGLSTNRSYSEGGVTTNDNYTMMGINITGFMGQSLGFFASSSFLLPNDKSSEVNGVSVSASLDIYDDIKMGLDMVAGLGYILPVSETISLLIGGGLHFSGIALFSSDYFVDTYLSYTVGPGVQATGSIEIAPGVYLSVSGLVGYDVSEITRSPDLPSGVSYNSSPTLAIAGGLGFMY